MGKAGLIVLLAGGIALFVFEWWAIRTTGDSTNIIGGVGLLMILLGGVGLWRRRRAR